MNLESRRKQISLVEQEFRLLQRNVHHSALIPLLAFKWEMSEDEECFYLYVAEQLVPGLSLNFFINVTAFILSILLCLAIFSKRLFYFFFVGHFKERL